MTGPRRVPSSVVAAHIETLVAAGVHTGVIALVAGVARHTVVNIRKQRTPMVNHQTAAILLAVKPHHARGKARGPHGYVSMLGTRRRVQALAAIGWSGLSLRPYLDGQRPPDHGSTWIKASTAERVRRAYDQLSMTPGPSARARTMALENQWPPPLAWDEGALDDPTAEPHPWLEEPDAA